MKGILAQFLVLIALVPLAYGQANETLPSFASLSHSQSFT
jgi:hypothetical protein